MNNELDLVLEDKQRFAFIGFDRISEILKPIIVNVFYLFRVGQENTKFDNLKKGEVEFALQIV